MTEFNRQEERAAVIANSLQNYYSRNLPPQRPRCMRDCWPIPHQQPKKKSGWKIDRGSRSEREMLAARARLREPVSNTTAILRMKTNNQATRKPDGAI